MTNIADILRNAPKGLKLYSSAFGDCKLACVIEDEITIEYFDGKNPDYITLDQYGRFKEDGECILFPYQYKHDWNGWQAWLFRDELSIGKVVVDTIGGYFIITRSEKDDIKVANSNGEEFVIESRDVGKYSFATIEDSADFFSKVNKNNCYWSNVEKTIIKNTHCCEPKGLYCNGNCRDCVYHTDSGCSREIEYDKSGCVSSCEKFTLANSAKICKDKQKPIDWSEEDEQRLKNLCTIIDDIRWNKATKDGYKNFLKSLKERIIR